jgi:CheY-like chemotaxis protein
VNASILVVDDEPFNLEIVGEYLSGEGHRLRMCGNGEEAWSALSEHEAVFDLVILDRMMPVLDGIALLKRIKAEDRFRAVPVIMQTAAASPEEVREGLAAGAYYYLTKPYQSEALLAIVRAALEERNERSKLSARIAAHADALRLMDEGAFSFRTLDEANQLAAFLAQACSNPDMAVMGLAELMINAVEHGNLGISYEEKKRLKLEDRWLEEVEQRLDDEAYRMRRACVRVRRLPGELEFAIADQGAGFAWAEYLELSPERAYDPNGRGIALARQVSFARLEYRDTGNVVVAAVDLRRG